MPPANVVGALLATAMGVSIVIRNISSVGLMHKRTRGRLVCEACGQRCLRCSTRSSREHSGHRLDRGTVGI